MNKPTIMAIAIVTLFLSTSCTRKGVGGAATGNTVDVESWSRNEFTLVPIGERITYSINANTYSGKKKLEHLTVEQAIALAETEALRKYNCDVLMNAHYNYHTKGKRILDVTVDGRPAVYQMPQAPTDNVPADVTVPAVDITPTVQQSGSSESANEPQLVYHTVKAGESLNSISKQYNVAVSDIVKWNKLKSTDLPIGTKLKLQVTGSATATSNGNAQLVYHTVKAGESLNSISKQYGVSVADIVKWNKLKSTTLQVGTRLKLQVD